MRSLPLAELLADLDMHILFFGSIGLLVLLVSCGSPTEPAERAWECEQMFVLDSLFAHPDTVWTNTINRCTR
jgi:hypothetical protein